VSFRFGGAEFVLRGKYKQWEHKTLRGSSLTRLSPIAVYMIPSAILVLVGAFFFPSAGQDDAHITYWAAYSLYHFGEVLNYNGDRVEQSSSLLQVILLALAAFVSKIDIVTLGKLSSVLFGVASLVALHILMKKIEPKAAFLAAVLTGTSAYFVYWSFGGLEREHYAFLKEGVFTGPP
jgi:hypothetical protein